MDPATLAIISAVASVAGGFMESKAQEAQTKSTMQQLQAQADASAYNARIAQQNAKIAESQTAAEVSKAGRERRMRLGANIATAGASGALGGANFLDIAMDNAAQEELNIQAIKQQGLLKQKSFLEQAGLDYAESRSASGQIPLVRKAGQMQSAAAMLSGGSKLAGSFAT